MHTWELHTKLSVTLPCQFVICNLYTTYESAWVDIPIPITNKQTVGMNIIYIINIIIYVE